MSQYIDPFKPIFNELSELRKLIIEIKNSPKEDYTLKYYTRKEVSVLTHCSIQTIDNYIDKGWIAIEKFGPKKKLIHHFQIFNEDQSLKDFKYKRKA